MGQVDLPGGQMDIAGISRHGDVAEVVVFLASEDPRYITRQMIAVHGGMSSHVGLGGVG